MKQCVDLCRRRVAYYEWKQTMLQMTMEDYNFFLKRIEKCSVCMSGRTSERAGDHLLICLSPQGAGERAMMMMMMVLMFDAHGCIAPFKSFDLFTICISEYK